MSAAFKLLAQYGFANDGQDRWLKGNVSGYCYAFRWSLYVTENGGKTHYTDLYDRNGMKVFENILKAA